MWSRNLTEQQRKETWIVLLQLGAIAVLAYSFIANVQAGMVMAVAWGQTSRTTGMSPLAHCESWAQFLQNQSTLNMIFGGPFLPVRAIITVKWFFPYRRFAVGVIRRSFAIAKQISTLESDRVYTLHVDCRQSCLCGGVDGRNGVVNFTVDRRACRSFRL